MVIFHSYVSLPEGNTSGPRVSSGFFLQINGKTPQVWGSPCVAATSPPTGAVPPASSVRTPRGFSKVVLGNKMPHNVGFGLFFWGVLDGFLEGFLGLQMIFCDTFLDVERYWLVNEGCDVAIFAETILRVPGCVTWALGDRSKFAPEFLVYHYYQCYHDICYIMLVLCWYYVGIMLVLCWYYVGIMLVLCWYYVGIMLVLCWYYVGIMLVLCWYYVGTMLVLCWYYVGFMLVLCWYYVGIMLVLCWYYVGIMLVLCWYYVGIVLVLCWYYVGIMLVLCWYYVGIMLVLCWYYVGIMLVLCWYYVGIYQYQNSIDNIATPWLLQTHDLFLFASTLHTASRPYSDFISQLERKKNSSGLSCYKRDQPKNMECSWIIYGNTI